MDILVHHVKQRAINKYRRCASEYGWVTFALHLHVVIPRTVFGLSHVEDNVTSEQSLSSAFHFLNLNSAMLSVKRLVRVKSYWRPGIQVKNAEYSLGWTAMQYQCLGILWCNGSTPLDVPAMIHLPDSVCCHQGQAMIHLQRRLCLSAIQTLIFPGFL